VARLKLTPQKREFFDLYNQAAANIVAIADRLVALLDRFPDGADDLGREVKELEHEGDRLTHELVDLLNRTFVTPFDRDDMYRLAGALDDICDHVDEAAGRIVSYGVGQIRLQAREQAQDHTNSVFRQRPIGSLRSVRARTSQPNSTASPNH
jgi:uncharacterized protein Yka (UPF0111/DUF47 family)